MLGNTLDGIEALSALDRFHTVSEAATRLRLTQSAVSKRLQRLQREVGFEIVEPDGRRLRLTADARELLERARPLLAELRALTAPPRGAKLATFSLALADSIAGSWGPAVVADALAPLRDVRIELHAHRSVLVIESVRLGRYHVGMSTEAPQAADLLHFPVIDEPMVLVRSGLAARGRHEALITIEQGSATWRAIEPLLRRHQPVLLERRLVPVESFGAALQMVKAGFGDGLAPLGLALELGLSPQSYRRLPGVQRGVSLLTRKTIYQLASFERLRDGIRDAAARYFARQ